MKRFVTLVAVAAAALGAADEPLPEVLRALETLGSASGARPSEDGRQVAFVTTLFGSRQAAVMPLDGGYPLQLTAEPGGVVAVRWSPTDPHALVAIAMRDGNRRLLLLDDEAGPAAELDPAPGDQLFGGFTRDGKKLFYGVVDGTAVSLRQVTIDPARKVTQVKPGAIAPQSPFPAAPTSPQPSTPASAVPAPPTMRGATPVPATSPGAPSSSTTAPPVARPSPIPIEEALRGLSAVGPVSPDGRTLLAQTRRRGDEVIWTVDLANARAEPLTPHEGTARFRLPRWSADGRTVYLLTDGGRETLGVDAVTVASRERKAIYAPNRPVEAFALTDDGHRLAVAEEANGQTVFSVLELPGLRAQPLPQPPGGALQPAPDGESPLEWTRPGDRLFFAWRQADDTTDVFAFRTGFGTTTRLTRSPRPGLGRRSIVRATPLRVARAGGGDVSGWMWKPRNAHRPRAALIVHGPEDPARPVLDPDAVALAAAGVAAIELNPRGPLLRPVTPDAYAADLAAALKSLRARDDLDARKPLLVAVGGGAAAAAKLLELEADGFAGVVGIDAEPKLSGALALESSSSEDLRKLVRYARERLK
jgi:dipeptidyl aminopeptidase/acylaminoacyl peptidase